MQGVRGSSPLASTIDVPVAQLDSAFDSDSKGCRFKSCRARHCILNYDIPDGAVAQLEEHNAGSVGVEGSSPFSSTI